MSKQEAKVSVRGFGNDQIPPGHIMVEVMGNINDNETIGKICANCYEFISNLNMSGNSEKPKEESDEWQTMIKEPE